MSIKVGNVVQAKVGTVARTNTSAKPLFILPPNAMVVSVRALGANSNAGTSATITLKSRPVDGSSAAATFATVDALDTVNGAHAATLTGITFDRQSDPVHITAEYAEAGIASSAGGPWSLIVEYL
jgi:hypothetical protein